MNYSNFKKIILFILLTAVVVGFSSIVVNVSFAQSLTGGYTDTNINSYQSSDSQPANTNVTANNLSESYTGANVDSGYQSLQSTDNQNAATSNSTSNSSSNGSQSVVNGNSTLQTKTAEDQAREVGVLANIIGTFAGYCLSATASLVDYAIQVGGSLTKLNAVKTGWSIMLSFANLGFVLAIIVIAFATILQRDNYAMKSTLSKLIIAALLVNFSLVIAGAFISVSNTVSNIFLNATTASSLSNALGHAMQPQQFWKGPELSTWNLIWKKGSYFFQYIVSLFFILIFTALMVLAMITLFIMLLIRIIALMILLIVSPVVWLLWIFPNTQKHWQKWWTEFIRWNIFAPTVLLFIYLTVVVASHTNELGTVNDSLQESGLLLSSGFMQHAANLLVILGFLVGGLFVANTFGIAGGSWGYSVANAAGKGVVNWSKRKGKLYGTGWLNKKRGEPGKEKSYADRVSEWSAKSRLAKYTILPGLAARGVAKLSVAGGENLVKDAKAAASKRSLNENLAMLGYADAPNRQAILQHIQEKDLLDKVPDVMTYINKKYETEASTLGQGVGYGNIQKSLGMNVEMKEAFDKSGKDSKEFYKAGEKFFSKFSEKDWAKPQYNEMFDSKPTHGATEELHAARQEVFVHAVGEVNTGQLAKTMSKIKAVNFDNYERVVRAEIDKMRTSNLEKIREKAEKIKESFDKALGRRRLGIDIELGTTETTESKEPKEEKKEEKKI